MKGVPASKKVGNLGSEYISDHFAFVQKRIMKLTEQKKIYRPICKTKCLLKRTYYFIKFVWCATR